MVYKFLTDSSRNSKSNRYRRIYCHELRLNKLEINKLENILAKSLLISVLRFKDKIFAGF